MSEVHTEHPKTTKTPLLKQPQFRKLLAILAASIALILLLAWLYNRNRESTDDAFIEANVVQISPHVSGYVSQVNVVDNQWVNQGQVLAEIDPKDYQVIVDQAQANLNAAKARHGASQHDVTLTQDTTNAVIAEASSNVSTAQAQAEQSKAMVIAAKAQAELAAADLTRFSALYQKDEISKQRLDQAQANQVAAQANWQAQQKAYQAALALVEAAKAKLREAKTAPNQVALKQEQAKGGLATVEEAEANLKAAELNLSYTKLMAPVAGRIVRKNLTIGQLLSPGSAVMGIVYESPWVVANFKETQLARMHPGEMVDIKIDAFPGIKFHGHVDSIQAGTGSKFSLLPPENATGNFVKIVQRVPVKIVFDNPANELIRLSPGMSVTPIVHLDDNR